MARADYNFRPNPARAVQIFGEFNEGLLAKVLPSIAAFRQINCEPITAYINSPGGSIRCLEILAGALHGEDFDEGTARCITVAAGDAGSAAATLLALGDYAIAHPYSVVHFHGARRSEVDVTAEDASSLMSQLSIRNRKIAHQLAETMMGRLMHRFSALSPKFVDMKKQKGAAGFSDIECFALSISRKTSVVGKRLVSAVLDRIRDAKKLNQTIMSKVKFASNAGALMQDVTVFKAVLEHEVKQGKRKGWRLDENGTSRLVGDYFVLRDFYFGEHQNLLHSTIKIFGRAFLSAGQIATLEKLEKESSAELAEDWLYTVTYERVKDFWYFTIVLCRQLQQGENRLTATDAYWLGAVDEVVGTNLFGQRAAAEYEPPPEDTLPL